VAPSPVKQAAGSLGVPLEVATDWSVILADMQALAPKVGVVIDYGRMLPSTLLRVPPHGFFGLHPSLLPRYRGSSPVASAILNGESETGVTVFRLNERMDAGEIAAQERMAIGPEDTTGTLTPKLAALGAELLCRVFDQLSAGSLRVSSQQERLASVTSKFDKADGRIDWTQPAASLDRRVHALQPWPGAWTMWRGEVLKIFMTCPVDRPSAGSCPGQVLDRGAQGIFVATGQGVLRIKELQAAGGKRMSAREFLSGHSLKVGEMLGDA
jgi:methionyl-tRNA formyltransferase